MILWEISESAQAALTEYYRLGDLHRDVFSHSPGSQESKIEVP